MDFMNAIKAIGEIKEKHGKPEDDVVDVMTCPECGGNLQYAVSSYNGHTQGSCDTDNCVRWMANILTMLILSIIVMKQFVLPFMVKITLSGKINIDNHPHPIV